MVANYNKLWKILIDRNIRKEDLRVAAGITTTAMAKLGKNQPVHKEILLKICKVLDCQLEDVVEITEDVDVPTNAILLPLIDTALILAFSII